MLTDAEREAYYDFIRTAPTMESLKTRWMIAAKHVTAANDPVAIRILTSWKDARKAELTRENESTEDRAALNRVVSGEIG